MSIPSIIKKRHSTREFTKESVSFEKMKALVESARLAPSACNLQLTEFIILDDGNVIEKLASKVSNKFKWAPNFIVAIYDPRFTKHREAGLQSTGMAIQNILLTAEELELGVCPMAGFEKDEKIKKILNIPETYEIALIIAVGNPRAGFEKKQERIELEKMMHHNKYEDKKNQLKSSVNIDEWSAEEIINYRQRIAPVYLYKNHFHLGNFNPIINQRALEKFEKAIGKDRVILDLFSYDCEFLKGLVKDFKFDVSKIVISDYLPYILDTIKDQKPEIKTALINKDNKIDLNNESIDVITCINKLNFTPNLDKLFTEMKRVLKPGGKVFIVDFNNSIVGAIFKKKKVNVYENNPFYKIGPYTIYHREDVHGFAKRAGFKNIKINPLDGTKGVSRRHNFYSIIMEC